MVKIGQTVSEIYHMHGAEQPRLRGKVIYIHPELRYYTVEFRIGNRSMVGGIPRAIVRNDGVVERDPDGIYVRESYLCSAEERMMGAHRREI